MGSSEVLDVEVHFPAFFTLTEDEQKEFFQKLQNYTNIYPALTWRFEVDQKNIDSEKLQNFFAKFYDFSNNAARSVH